MSLSTATTTVNPSDLPMVFMIAEMQSNCPCVSMPQKETYRFPFAPLS